MKRSKLIDFIIRFSVAAAVLLAVFHFTFPLYRSLLKSTIHLFTQTADIQSSERIHLTFMPYVSISALILATPKKSVKSKLKSLLIVFSLFFAIDIFFSIVQILLQNTAIEYYHILLVQDFLTISMPLVIWVLFSYEEFDEIFGIVKEELEELVDESSK